MDIEGLLRATVPVVLGVLIAGYIMSALGSSVSLIGSAQAGYTGQGS